MTAALDLDGPHWRFALEVYGAPGAADACLRLQDEFGVDVNVLLVALYGAVRRGVAIGADEVAVLDAAAAAWRERVVVPLRTLRRDLKTGFDGVQGAEAERLRGEVKSLEFRAERVGQAALAQALDGLPAGGSADGRAALAAVIAFYAGRTPADAGTVRELIETILNGAIQAT